METYELIVYSDMNMLRSTITGNCQKKGHVQQVAYSTYHDSLTQVCFTCGRVRTTIREANVQKDAQLIGEEALNEEIPTLRDVEEAKDCIKNGTIPSTFRVAKIVDRLLEAKQKDEVQGEETFDELELTFPDNEALADFLIQGSNEAEIDAACFQEAYRRIFKVAQN